MLKLDVLSIGMALSTLLIHWPLTIGNIFQTAIQTAYADDGTITTGGETIYGDAVTVYEDGGSKFVERHNTYIPETVVGLLNARQAKVTNTTIQIQNAKTYEWIGAVHTATDADGKVTTFLSKI